jgi:hypothetical protein
MENPAIKNIQHNLTTTFVRPLYADEIVVAHTIKTGKDEKGKITREGHIHLVFIDMTTQKPIEKIVISPITAKGLVKALDDSVKKLAEEVKKKKVEKSEKLEKREKRDYDYIR